MQLSGAGVRHNAECIDSRNRRAITVSYYELGLKENQDLTSEILDKTIICFFICLPDSERFRVGTAY
jgi:hypothetical protein